MLWLFSKKQFGKSKMTLMARTNMVTKAFFLLVVLCIFLFMYLDFRTMMNQGYSSTSMWTGFFIFLAVLTWMTAGFVHVYEKAIIFPDFDTDFFSIGQMYILEFSSVTSLVLGKNSLLMRREDGDYILSTTHLNPAKFKSVKKFLKQNMEDRVVELPIVAECPECQKKIKHSEPGPFLCPHCHKTGEFTGEEPVQEAGAVEEGA